MTVCVSIDIPEETPYVPFARSLARSTLRPLHVSPADVGDVETIVDELCSNAIRHARSARGRFTLKLECHADRVVVTVRDRGRGFRLADIPPPGTVRRDPDGGERLGGFGVTIARALADGLRCYGSGGRGATARAEKRLTDRTPEAAGGAAP